MLLPHSQFAAFVADFGTQSIAADVPTGRISPNASPNMRAASAGLYDTEQRFQSGLNGATKSGGILNLDFCRL